MYTKLKRKVGRPRKYEMSRVLTLRVSFDFLRFLRAEAWSLGLTVNEYVYNVLNEHYENSKD